MRPPPLAKIAAVAAPRPEAEPVTIAKNPSFDIPDFLFLLLTGRWPARVGRTISRGVLPANRAKSVARNYSSTHRYLWPLPMPVRQAALRTSALVMALAFPHHRAQEKAAHRAPTRRPDAPRFQKRGTLWRRVKTSSSRPRRRFLRISPIPRPSTATRKASGKRRCGRR